jgi:hypothetical protein
MKALALALAFLGAGPDELVPVRVNDISIGIPGSWKRSVEDGSVKYTAPTLAAFFFVNTDHVQTAGMDPLVCREKILAKMPPASSWTLLTVGGAPAAKRLDVDIAKDANHTPIHTYTYVGCNGAITWSVVFHLDSKKKERFAPLADRVVQSITFTPGAL